MAEINVKGIRELSFNTTHIYNLVYFITPYLLDNHFFLNVIFKKALTKDMLRRHLFGQIIRAYLMKLRMERMDFGDKGR